MDFMTALKNQNDQRKTLTENGAVAYATSGKEVLDFNFQLGALRTAPVEKVMEEFQKVFYEDPMVAVKYLFWVRDVRGGAGERKVFRAGFKWIAENKPNIAKVLIPLVPEYGRFDDLWILLDTTLKDDVIEFIRRQMDKDFEAIENEIV